MSYLIAYLCKMTLISGILYAYYYAVLRDNRFHQWNRFYLLISVLLTLALPLVHIPVRESPETDSRLLYAVLRWLGSDQTSAVVMTHPSSYWTRFTWDDAMLFGYAGIGTGLFVLLIKRLWQIDRLRKRSPQVHLDKITLIETRDVRAPFSFFKWVFWNESVALSSTEGQHILRHELTHVRQRHSLDKIVMQLLCILFFPVVFFYLIRRELQLIHEYLADQQATRNANLAEYAHLLISQTFQATPFAFANHFFQHPLKRRIAMMMQFSHPRFSYLKKIMILPLAAVLFGAMAFRVTASHPGMINGLQEAADQWEGNLTPTGTIYETFKKPVLPLVRDTTPVSATALAITPQTRITFDQGRKGSMDSVLVVIDGKNPTYGNCSLEKINPNNIKSITVLKGDEAIGRYGDSARNGVILINMKQPGDTLPGVTVVRMNHPGTTSSDNDDKIFTKVQVEASFPGGDSIWNRYVRGAIMEHINDLIKDNRSGTCELTFVVYRDGHISHVEVSGMEGSQLDVVAMNIIKNGPHWIPARQNGHKVSSFRKQKITFQMPD
jgi:hypothetical protein